MTMRRDLKNLWRSTVPYRVSRRESAWLLPATLCAVGVVTGMLVGMLVAPQRGAEARRSLRRGASRLRDRSMRALGRGSEQFEQLGRNVERELESARAHDVSS